MGPSPGYSCGDGEVYDCVLECVDAETAYSWVGDGYCDDGTYGMVLDCEAFDFDDGDCD